MILNKNYTLLKFHNNDLNKLMILNYLNIERDRKIGCQKIIQMKRN